MKRLTLTVMVLVLLASPALAEDFFYPIVIKKPCPPPPMELAWSNSTPTVTGSYYFRPIEAEGSTWAFLGMYDVAAPTVFPWPVQFAGPIPVPAGANAVVIYEANVPEEVLAGVPFDAVKGFADQLTNSTAQ